MRRKAAPPVADGGTTTPTHQGLGGLDFSQLLQPQEMFSLIREIVSPGKDAKDLARRTDFKDPRQLSAWVNYMSKCLEFEDKEGLEVGIIWAAGLSSIGGQNMNRLVEIGTQTLAPALHNIKTPVPVIKASNDGYRPREKDGD